MESNSLFQLNVASCIVCVLQMAHPWFTVRTILLELIKFIISLVFLRDMEHVQPIVLSDSGMQMNIKSMPDSQLLQANHSASPLLTKS